MVINRKFVTKNKILLLTGILFRIKVNIVAGLDGGDEQFALKTSPGSYRSFSVKIAGLDSGRTAKK